MSDSDAEFERFLQESLSSSSASYQSFVSELSRSRGRTRNTGLTGSLVRWREGSESDHELEAVGQSWLRPLGPGDTGRPSPHLTLPALREGGEISRDSLEGSDVKKGSSRPSSKASYKSEEGDFQDTFSLNTGRSSGGGSVMSESAPSLSLQQQQLAQWQQPGLDTLEEAADKQRFFRELEEDRSSPVDYSELNRQLGDTGLSSLTLGTPHPTLEQALQPLPDEEETPRQSEHSDQESDSTPEPPHGKDHSSPSPDHTSHSSPSHKPHNKPQETPTHMHRHQQDFAPSHKHTTIGPNTSVSSLRSHGSLTAPQRNKTESPIGLHLSPILTAGTRVQDSAVHGLDSSGRSYKSVSSGSHSGGVDLASSLDEQRGFLLSPIHTTELTASGHFEFAPKTQAAKFQSPSHVSESITLSPLVKESAPSKAKTATVRDLSSQSNSRLLTQELALSPLHMEQKKSSERLKIRSEQSFAKGHSRFATAAVGRQSVARKTKTQETTNQGRQETVGRSSSSAAPTTRLERSSASVGVSEDTLTAVTGGEHVSLSVSGLERDFTELQSALEAAGLPKLGESTAPGPQEKTEEPPSSEERIPAGKRDNAEGKQSPSSSQPRLGGMSIEETVRAIAAEELASLTKEILLQDLESGQRTDAPSQSKGETVKPQTVESAPTTLDQDSSTELSRLPVPPVAAESVRDAAVEPMDPRGVALSPIHTTSDSHHGRPVREQRENEKQDTNQSRRSSASSVSSKKQVGGSSKRTKREISAHFGQGVVSSEGRHQKPSGQLRASKSAPRSIPKSSDVSSNSATVASSPGMKLPPSSARKGVIPSKGGKTRSVRDSALKTPSKHSSTMQSAQFGVRTTRVSGSKGHALKGKETKPSLESSGIAMATSVESLTELLQTKVDVHGSSIGSASPYPSPFPLLVSSAPDHCEREGSGGGWIKEAWQQEKSHCEELQTQLGERESEREKEKERESEREKEREREKEKEREKEREREGRVQEELQHEIFALNVKLRDLESAQNSRQRLARGGEVGAISQEEKSALQRDIREQETLLQGYQKENERLYQELGRAQRELKAVKAQLYQENQRLATELLNARTELERLSRRAPLTHSTTADSAQSPAVGGAALSAARIAQLEDKLEQAQQNCRELEKQVKQLLQANESLERDVRDLRGTKRELEGRATRAVGREELQQIKEKHKAEMASLVGKLAWYAENQRLLDQDSALLQTKEREIAELRERLGSVKGSKQRGAGNRGRREEERRVQVLERRVRELEGVIRRRFPNSLSALILASSSKGENPQGGKPEVGVASGQEAPPTHTHLQCRVRQLEEALETKDVESARRIRALQQKYSAMEIMYEQQLSSLRDQLDGCPHTHPHTVTTHPHSGTTHPLSGTTHPHTGTAHPHTAVTALERELASARETHRVRVAELESEVRILRQRLQGGERGEGGGEGEGGDRGGRTSVADSAASQDESLLTRVKQLEQEKATLRGELERARGLWRREGEEGRGREGEVLAMENQQLKEKLSQMTFDLAHQRVQLQGQLAHAESRVRLLQEEVEEKVASLRQEHSAKVDGLVAKFARDHTHSEVSRLQSKVSSLEATVSHLRDQLDTARMDSELLAAARAREEELSQHIRTLSEELLEARRHHTPKLLYQIERKFQLASLTEMHHFSALQAKISSLETRTSEYEAKMKHSREMFSKPSETQMKEVELKWRRHLQAKNSEIEQFRDELDSLLATLQVLREGTVAL